MEASSIYLTAFEGLNVSEADELRGKILDADARMQVIKNRLLQIAIEGTEYECLADLLTGPNALTYCSDDPIEPLKALTDFADEHEQPPVKAGVVEGEMLSPEQLQRLSRVPPRDQLLGQMVRGFAGPISGLVHTFRGVVSELVYTMRAVAEEQEGEAG